MMLGFGRQMLNLFAGRPAVTGPASRVPEAPAVVFRRDEDTAAARRKKADRTRELRRERQAVDENRLL